MTIKEIASLEISLRGSKLNLKAKYEFFNSLSILISTGIQIKDAIQILYDEQKENSQLRKILNHILIDLTIGKTLSECIKESKKFTDYEIYSIELGEETGLLSNSLNNLSEYLKSILDIKRKLVSALSYPLITLIIAIIAIVFMLNFVVPMFTDIFLKFGKELPPITQFVIEFSKNIKFYLLLSIGFIVILMLIHLKLKKNSKYLDFIFASINKIPIIGKLILKSNLARFSSAMELFVSSGVPIAKAIRLNYNMSNYYPIKKALINIENKLIGGDNFYESIKGEIVFDRRMVAMIKVGTEVNKLELIFKKLKIGYNEDVMYETTILNGLIEPLLIVVIGSFIAFILIALYLPIFQMSSSLSF